MLNSKLVWCVLCLSVIFSVGNSCEPQYKEERCKSDSTELKTRTTEINNELESGTPSYPSNPSNPSNQECMNRGESMPKALPFFDIRFDPLPPKCVTDVPPKNCAEATACTQRNGVYKILVPENSYEPFHVECDAETEGGDWIVIQRRQDGSEDFYRNWLDYEKGFGDVDGEYFLGLKKIYALTNFHGPQELLVLMGDENNTIAYAKYNTFAIGSGTEEYILKRLGKFTGPAGDSLTSHLGMKFTTKDCDNDNHEDLNCAEHSTGGWWYSDCHDSNLNGKYGDNNYGKGINWLTFTGRVCSLKYVKMMIRRRRI